LRIRNHLFHFLHWGLFLSVSGCLGQGVPMPRMFPDASPPSTQPEGDSPDVPEAAGSLEISLLNAPNVFYAKPYALSVAEFENRFQVRLGTGFGCGSFEFSAIHDLSSEIPAELTRLRITPSEASSSLRRVKLQSPPARIVSGSGTGTPDSEVPVPPSFFELRRLYSNGALLPYLLVLPNGRTSAFRVSDTFLPGRLPHQTQWHLQTERLALGFGGHLYGQLYRGVLRMHFEDREDHIPPLLNVLSHVFPPGYRVETVKRISSSQLTACGLGPGIHPISGLSGLTTLDLVVGGRNTIAAQEVYYLYKASTNQLSLPLLPTQCGGLR
jgi:hypothetical protein